MAFIQDSQSIQDYITLKAFSEIDKRVGRAVASEHDRWMYWPDLNANDPLTRRRAVACKCGYKFEIIDVAVLTSKSDLLYEGIMWHVREVAAKYLPTIADLTDWGWFAETYE